MKDNVEAKNGNRKAIWPVSLVIVLIIAGGACYFLGGSDSETPGTQVVLDEPRVEKAGAAGGDKASGTAPPEKSMDGGHADAPALSLAERHEEFLKLAKERTVVKRIRVDAFGSVTFELGGEHMDELNETAEQLARLYFEQVPEAKMMATGLFRAGRIAGSRRFHREALGM